MQPVAKKTCTFQAPLSLQSSISIFMHINLTHYKNQAQLNFHQNQLATFLLATGISQPHLPPLKLHALLQHSLVCRKLSTLLITVRILKKATSVRGIQVLCNLRR